MHKSKKMLTAINAQSRTILQPVTSIIKHKIFLIFFCLPVIALQAQIVKKYVQANSVAILSVSPDSLDFSDLAPLQKAIGHARVVMLGEQDHGDAPTFLAKTRLIKFLHQKMGFDVLAFESDFFALNEGFDRLLPAFRKNPLLLDSFLQKSVFPIWTYCDACKPLFDSFIPSTYATNNPLLLTGFDNQVYLPYATKYLTHSLDSVLRANDLPVTKLSEYTSVMIPLFDSLSHMTFNRKDTAVFSNVYRYLTEIKKEMAVKFSKDNFWMMLIDNLLMENQEFKDSFNKRNIFESINTRDFQMAQNLRWICHVKYPNKKIIVWAANFHISKFSGHYNDNTLNKYRSMGTVFAEDIEMKKETYVLGFTSYQGTAGRVGSKPYALYPPKRDAFENLLPKEWAYGFVDFSKLNTPDLPANEMFYMSAHGHSSYKAVWNKVFDGMFYIKNMYPCKATVKYSDPK